MKLIEAPLQTQKKGLFTIVFEHLSKLFEELKVNKDAVQ